MNISGCHSFHQNVLFSSCRERQAELSAAGGDRLQHASDHHLHEADEAAVFGHQQGLSAQTVTVSEACDAYRAPSYAQFLYSTRVSQRLISVNFQIFLWIKRLNV